MRDLECFFAVAAELHFGRAAERMNLAQSTLSEAIGRLERDLGVRLLDRSTRNVSLTDAGTTFLRDATDAHRQLEAAYERTRQLGRAHATELQVGYTLDARDEVHALLGAARTMGVRLTPVLHQLPSPAQVAALKDEKLDAGVCWLPALDDELEALCIGHGRLVAAVPAWSRLARATSVSRRQLTAQPLVRWTREANPRLFDAFGPVEASNEVTQGSGSGAMLDNLLARVHAGDGAAVLLDSTARLYPTKGIVYVPIEGGDLIPHYLVWRRGNANPLLRGVVAAARRWVDRCDDDESPAPEPRGGSVPAA